MTAMAMVLLRLMMVMEVIIFAFMILTPMKPLRAPGNSSTLNEPSAPVHSRKVCCSELGTVTLSASKARTTFVTSRLCKRADNHTKYSHEH